MSEIKENNYGFVKASVCWLIFLLASLVLGIYLGLQYRTSFFDQLGEWASFQNESSVLEKETKYTVINQQGLNLLEESDFFSDQTDGVMLMIEFGEDALGLSNFVNMLNTRNIPGVLLVSPDYIEANCETINAILDTGIELGAGVNTKPFWDVPYQEQYELMKETKEVVKACTGKDLRMFNSRYFAYDENTLKAAEALDIDYVFARGTTGERATIYQPEEYDVKIFSVSNINSKEYGTGSLCDYSYWARAGEPSDFQNQLFHALSFDQISPVSHTYLGGLKKKWNDVYLEFFDNSDINWKTMDEFTENVDLFLPVEEIPQNREVEYVEPKATIPLEDEINVDNPCAVEDLGFEDNNVEEMMVDEVEQKEIFMFHNNQGPMCLDALDFFAENNYEFTEYLTSEDDFSENLNNYMSLYVVSEGISESFEYYPIIFIGDKAFSGFDDEIAGEIEELLK